ncbi:MAG TPA: hypothetical protein PK325_08790 [Cyclobacteriaceae bacterium]|nr:hypothetical protein [Cyclobacteriaceae bacterium]HMV10163.1 hypothetical protein [Cyclobacteriaceae bacterium]HMV91777.1 hypothetical protein [Cyclobacteriaceae bacterium]HMX00522.1 hypothetical protein [Cyclobacteriaceae bacterium]HMX49603.1 hypothetical protein [Cyclobacteriaceae bacterium]
MKKLIHFFLLGTLASCGSDNPVDDPIPFQPFADVVINYSLPAYSALQIDGGHITIPYSKSVPAGIKGLIVYRENSTTFRAFEQNCSFQPNDACASVQAYALYMQDACCGSIFNYEGEPTGGLAFRPLGQYEIHVSGTTLTITDNVINY